MPLQVYSDQTHRASEYDWLDGYVLPPSVMDMLLPRVPTDMYLLHSEHHFYLDFAVFYIDTCQYGHVHKTHGAAASL